MLRTHKYRIALLTALLTMLVMPLPVRAQEPDNAMSVIKPKVRMEAPDFTLVDIYGKPRGLSDFKGKVIVLNFWATFCGPCREEMPAMEKLWREFKDRGLVIIAVAGDKGQKSMHKVKEFCEMYGVSFPVLLDPKGDVRRNYEVVALPTSYIIGRDNKLSGKIIGARHWDAEESRQLFDAILKE